MILTKGYGGALPNLLYNTLINSTGTPVYAFAGQYSIIPDISSGNKNTILIIPIPGKVRTVGLSNSNFLKLLGSNLEPLKDKKLLGFFQKSEALDKKYESMIKRIRLIQESYSDEYLDPVNIKVCPTINSIYDFLSTNWSDIHLSESDQKVIFNGINLLYSKSKTNSNSWSFVLLKVYGGYKYTPMVEIIYEQTYNFTVNNNEKLIYFPTVSNVNDHSMNIYEGLPDLMKPSAHVNNLIFVKNIIANDYNIVTPLDNLNDTPLSSFYGDTHAHFLVNGSGTVLNGDVFIKSPLSQQNTSSSLMIYTKHLIN
jgi:hypothetical protein